MAYKKEQIRSLVLNLSMACFIISLFLPSFSTRYDNEGELGFTVLLLGAFQVFQGGAAISWLANPFLVLSWFLSKKSRLALKTSGLSTVLILSFLFFDEVKNGKYTSGTDYQTVRIDLQIESINSGYLFWLCSSLLLVIGHFWILNSENPFFRNGLKEP